MCYSSSGQQNTHVVHVACDLDPCRGHAFTLGLAFLTWIPGGWAMSSMSSDVFVSHLAGPDSAHLLLSGHFRKAPRPQVGDMSASHYFRKAPRPQVGDMSASHSPNVHQHRSKHMLPWFNA